jgi:hypothetical protein
MAGSVGDVGRKADPGFFTEKGELRVEKRDKAPEPQSTEKNKESGASSGSDVSTRASQAFDSRRTDVNKQVNDVVNVLNENKAVLQEEKKIAKQEKALVREIGDAKKEGRTEDVERAKEAFSKLQDKRVDLEKRAAQQNVEQDANRSFTIRLGNKEVGKGEIKRVSVTKQERVSADSLDSAEGRKAVIESRNEEINKVDSQIGEIRKTTKDVKAASTDAREELSTVEKKTIGSFKEAEEVTGRLAKDIRQGGITSVNTNQLDPGVVSRLLAQ